MCFLANENIENEIVQIRTMGYETTQVANTTPGADDDVVLQDARVRGCILITSDRDFGELVFRQKKTTAGVLFLRMPGLSPASKAEVVRRAMEDHASRLPGSFVVLGPRAMRVRTDLR